MKTLSLRATLWILLVAWLPGSSLVAQVAQTARPVLTLDDLWVSGRFFGSFFQGGQWADEGPVITFTEINPETGAQDLIRYDLERDERTPLIDGTTLLADDVGRPIVIEGYAYAPDERTVLLYTDSAPVWRLYTQGFYYLYDVASGELTPLSDREKGYQLFAKFNPDGRRVAFVRDRNLFVVDTETMTETQLTSDGSEGGIINGTTDWVYEEEFWLRDAWAWSPDGRYLAFLQLDESNTRDFTMADLRGMEPAFKTFRFPKAGEANSEVRVGVVDVTTNAVSFFDTDTWNEGGDESEYIARLGWTPAGDRTASVWMIRLNRDQNQVDLLYGDPATGDVRVVLEEAEDTWIDVTTFTFPAEKVIYLEDGEHFLWRSEIDGYNHLYLYTNDGERVRQVTSGAWEVFDVHGVDPKGETVFFTASAESPLERHLYRAPLFPKRRQSPDPVQLTTAPGTHTIDLSGDARYYIDTYSTRNTPPVTQLHRIDGSPVTVLDDNADLVATLEEYNVPKAEFLTVPAADGTPLHAYMIKPVDFDSTRAYPLLLHTYGGPGAQSVTDGWEGFLDLWHLYLAAEHDVIVACVDNRGASGYGKAFTSAVYKRMGTVEPQDQIAAAKHFGALPYIDAERIGIWGWSYGGYNTLLSLFKYDGPETFKLGIAVAPGVDWRLYDTIYTERYMSMPQNNPEGYAQGNPENFVEYMAEDQHLLIVQGDQDDNVHFQQTVHLISALQQARKPFQLMIYPGGNHSMAGTGNPYVYFHLFMTLTNFLTANL